MSRRVVSSQGLCDECQGHRGYTANLGGGKLMVKQPNQHGIQLCVVERYLIFRKVIGVEMGTAGFMSYPFRNTQKLGESSDLRLVQVANR